MYVIKHSLTNTIFSIRPKTKEKISVCVFPSNNHAKRVADNIARFKYSQNEFPSLSNFENLLKHSQDLLYENDFTPFNDFVSSDWYDIYIEPMHDMQLFNYCRSGNLDIVFCMLYEHSSDKDLIFMPIQNSIETTNYLEKCYINS